MCYLILSIYNKIILPIQTLKNISIFNVFLESMFAKELELEVKRPLATVEF